MATPRKPRPSFDVPAAKAPDTAGWAYRTDGATPAVPAAQSVQAKPAATPSPAVQATDTPAGQPSALTRVVTAPFFLCTLILLTPFSWFGRPSPPR